MLKKEKIWEISLNLTVCDTTDDFMKSFRTNLDKFLQEKEITYSNLAEEAGISFSTLKTLMASSGKDCNLSTAIKLAKALGITVDELVGAGTMSEGTKECVSKCIIIINVNKAFVGGNEDLVVLLGSNFFCSGRIIFFFNL